MGRPDLSSIDPKTGFCSETGTFRSLRPPLPLPPGNTAISAASYALSLQSISPWPESTALIDSSTGHRISYSDFRRHVAALASFLRNETGLCKNDVVFVICSNSTRIPILYFALLSIGAVVCPANPLSSSSEISRQIQLAKPVLAFATSATKSKASDRVARTILVDSPEFESTMSRQPASELTEIEIRQNDVAAILFSSGTTGQMKAVALTHRNFIAITADYYYWRPERSSPSVGLYPVPYFHIFGFQYALRSVALGEAVVVMERFELGTMLKAVEEYKVTNIALVPPVVVAMLKSNLTEKFDLRSLESVGCGAAPLHVDLMKAFAKKFPRVFLHQGYGMTETTAAAFRIASADEYVRWGSAGKLVANCEAKIVDLDTGIVLPPGKQGELWFKGPTVMKGYVDNPKANSETLSGGWLRTGDICYIDDQGFLFVVDRLKELIKYKGYQVAPAELEQLLLSHSDIIDAAVIPYPDEEAGEVPLAFVVRRPQSNLGSDQVIEFIQKQQVAPFKKVRRVVFVNSIPKSASGKILRKELKKISLPDSKL